MKLKRWLIIMSLFLVACSADEHIGEVKTPSGSTIMKGKEYQEVIEEFESRGFNNIKVETIEDLITGWLVKDGEVDQVSVGGDIDYSPGKWVPSDIEVIIYYHTFRTQEKEENNNPSENESSEMSIEYETELHTEQVQTQVPTDVVMSETRNNSTTVSDTLEEIDNTETTIYSDIVSLEMSETTKSENIITTIQSSQTTIKMDNIIMPYDNNDYSMWFVDECVRKIQELGFQNISIYGNEPTADNIEQSIFEINESTGWFSSEKIKKGEKYSEETKIVIEYNSNPPLTTDNCKNIYTVLSRKSSKYMDFVEKYDDYNVMFNAIVTENYKFTDGFDNIIEVCFDDGSGFDEYQAIRIGIRHGKDNIDVELKQGEQCRVVGKISKRWSEYYKMLYVEGLILEAR